MTKAQNTIEEIHLTFCKGNIQETIDGADKYGIYDFFTAYKAYLLTLGSTPEYHLDQFTKVFFCDLQRKREKFAKIAKIHELIMDKGPPAAVTAMVEYGRDIFLDDYLAAFGSMFAKHARMELAFEYHRLMKAYVTANNVRSHLTLVNPNKG